MVTTTDMTLRIHLSFGPLLISKSSGGMGGSGPAGGDDGIAEVLPSDGTRKLCAVLSGKGLVWFRHLACLTELGKGE